MAATVCSRRLSSEGGKDFCSRVCVCLSIRVFMCVFKITAMCAGLLHAAVEAPAGLGRATGTGWRRMGFEFHLVDYFYEHSFNKVHIKMMIKVSCGG